MLAVLGLLPETEPDILQITLAVLRMLQKGLRNFLKTFQSSARMAHTLWRMAGVAFSQGFRSLRSLPKLHENGKTVQAALRRRPGMAAADLHTAKPGVPLKEQEKYSEGQLRLAGTAREGARVAGLAELHGQWNAG